ncbi:MAG: PTS sugar transporter subunit IIB [Atopobiaceae bacterium]|jgi:PTS system galactitol-specific IIB component
MASRVIVACGSGLATSLMVAKKIDKLLRDKGMDVVVDAVSKEALPEEATKADAYVAVVQLEQTYNIPTFDGVAFLTGIDEEEELERLIAQLKQAE